MSSAGAAGRGGSRSIRVSSSVEPHSPQLEVIGVNRAVGTGARPPVSTVTTLNALSMAEPVAQ